MEKPKSIYLQRYSYGALLPSYSTKPKAMADGENIEYIPKDDIVQWLEKEKATAELTDFDEFGHGELRAIERILVKIKNW